MKFVSPMGQLRPFFVDKNGKRLAGGEVHTYEAGTLTPKNTFRDGAGTIPNTNPIILDGSGEADIYLSGFYRFRVLDRQGNLIFDVDDFKTLDEINLAVLDNAVQQTEELRNSAAELVSEAEALLSNTTEQANAAEDAATNATTQVNGLKGYVDSALTGLSFANKTYATLAAANADISNIAVNQSVWVSSEAEGGLYEKKTAGATSLTKSAYDPLLRAKNYTDSQNLKIMQSYEDSVLTLSSQVLSGTATDLYNSSDYIPVIAGQVLQINAQVFQTNEPYIFYTLNKAKLAKDTSVTYNGIYSENVIVPKGACFIRIMNATVSHPNYVNHSFSLKVFDEKVRPVNITYKDFLDRATGGTYGSLTTANYKHLWLIVDGGQVLKYSNLIAINVDALRIYDKDYNLLSSGHLAPSGTVKVPASGKYAVFTCISSTHASYTSSLATDFAIKIGLVDEIAIESNLQLTAQLEKKIKALEAGGLVAYFADAFTEAGTSGTYSRTKKIETLGMKKVFVLSQASGPAVIIRKYVANGAASNLLQGSGTSVRVYGDIYDIPSDAVAIDVQSMNATHASYDPDLDPIVVLSNSEDAIIKYLTSYFASNIPSGFDYPNKHPVYSSTNYDSTKKIMFAPGMSFEYSVNASGGGALVTNTELGTNENIAINKQTLNFKNFGWLRLGTYNSTHASYNPSFVPHFAFVSSDGAQTPTNQFVLGSYLPTIHLKVVREATFLDGTDKTAIQYLWYDADFNFFVSDTRTGERKFIFTYSLENFYGYEPHWFSMGFDPNGNIICVFRTEGLAQNYNDDVRKNPIVLLKSKNYDPQVIPVPGDIRPSGWLQNCGFLCTEDAIFFTEYTRPSVQTANTWKVAMPVTEPANWRKVQSFTVNPDGTDFKHIHNVERDPHTGFIYTSTGDNNVGAGIYVSTDNGETFTKILSGSEKYCRVLNFVWLKDRIYWATDSSGNNHWVFKATRNSEGILDVNNIIDLHHFPNESKPTYASIYLPKIKAILFLGRADGSANDLPIELLDLVDDSFHIIDTLHPTNRTAKVFGFRCECFEYIPRGNELICGFSRNLGPGGYLSTIGMLGNTDVISRKINNMVITVERIGSGFTINYSTVT